MAGMLPFVPDVVTALRCTTCGAWNGAFVANPEAPRRHYNNGKHCKGEWEQLTYRLVAPAAKEVVEPDNGKCSPACFGDCDGTDEDGHVPEDAHSPELYNN